jgi:hypothetical protein
MDMNERRTIILLLLVTGSKFIMVLRSGGRASLIENKE